MGEKARGTEERESERGKKGRKGGEKERRKGGERESVYMCVMEGDAYRVHGSKKCKNRKSLTR